MVKYFFDDDRQDEIEKVLENFTNPSDVISDDGVFQNNTYYVNTFEIVSDDDHKIYIKISDKGKVYVKYEDAAAKEAWKDRIESAEGKAFLGKLGKFIINKSKVRNTTKKKSVARTANLVSRIGMRKGLPPLRSGPLNTIHKYLGHNIPVKPRNTPINRNYKNFSSIPPTRGGRKRKTRKVQRGGQSDTSIAQSYPGGTVVSTNFEDGVDAVPRLMGNNKFVESHTGPDEPAAEEQAH